jgi:hypothetical protein
MPLPVLWLLQLLQRWFGWDWAVLVVRREDDVRTLKLPGDLPVSVRENTDGSVGLTVGYDDDGGALLADLRALIGSACSSAQSEMTRQEPSRMV